VPDSNIPNRDPFFGQAQQFEGTRPGAPWGAEEVVPALDPMAARAPVDTWQPDARGIDALLHTLGTFFAEADVHALARALARGGKTTSRSARPGGAAVRAAAAPGPVQSDTKAHPLRDAASLLKSAVAAVAGDTRAGSTDALASAAFRRGALLRALASHLGMEAEAGCCDQAPALPPAVLEGSEATAPATIPAALRPFYAHCSACHDMPTASPPGFLHGSIEAVERNIARCAPRIRFRLAMWQLPAASRAKTPMPPPVFVPAWERAAPRSDIERMTDYVLRAMPATATGRVPDTGYEALPRCREPGPQTVGMWTH
jgi:hypothetical protein